MSQPTDNAPSRSPAPRRRALVRLTRLTRTAVAALTTAAALPTRAWAHDAPDRGAEWLMADWMLFAFLVFFVAALFVFVVALRRGLLSNLEAAKYHVLSIREPDYYTPAWAREETPP